MDAPNAPVASRPTGFLDRHYHLLRRLQSLTGVLPIGVFLFPHLTTNSSVVWGGVLNRTKFEEYGIKADGAGAATFQHEVDFIHSLPALILIEIAVLWLPIAYHAGMGIVFARTGRLSGGSLAYGGQKRYVAQRLTGYVGLLFIFMHISSLRWGWTYGGLFPQFDASHAASTTAEHFQGSSLPVAVVTAFYLVGVLSLVFHFANGLWTAAITWGLTVTRQAQARWGYACAAIGCGLAAAGVTAILGFATLDPAKAREAELALQKAKAPAASPSVADAAGNGKDLQP